jgi:hypothetical protein
MPTVPAVLRQGWGALHSLACRERALPILVVHAEPAVAGSAQQFLVWCRHACRGVPSRALSCVELPAMGRAGVICGALPRWEWGRVSTFAHA